MDRVSAAERRPDAYYKRIYALFRPIFHAVCRVTYGVRVKSPREFGESVLILANHTSDMDFLVVAEHIRDHMYFVASEHVAAMGLFGKYFDRWFNPIKVTKGSSKAGGVMDIMRRLRRGNCVLLFAEGRISHNGRSTYITPATAKLAKSVKCRVVTFRTSGGFFIEPRWQNYLNRGRLFTSGIVHEYSAEEMAAMTVDEALAHIREDLCVDAYAEQEKLMRPFKFRHGLRDITRYYDVCPRCHGLDCLGVEGEGMTVKCRGCGYELTMDSCGFFHGEGDIVRTCADWEEIQLREYRERFERGEFFTEEGVQLCRIGEGFELEEIGTGTLTSDAGGLSLCGERFPFHELTAPEILSGGRKLELSRGREDFMLLKENACLNKFVELYKWAAGGHEG